MSSDDVVHGILSDVYNFEHDEDVSSSRPFCQKQSEAAANLQDKPYSWEGKTFKEFMEHCPITSFSKRTFGKQKSSAVAYSSFNEQQEELHIGELHIRDPCTSVRRPQSTITSGNGLLLIQPLEDKIHSNAKVFPKSSAANTRAQSETTKNRRGYTDSKICKLPDKSVTSNSIRPTEITYPYHIFIDNPSLKSIKELNSCKSSEDNKYPIDLVASNKETGNSYIKYCTHSEDNKLSNNTNNSSNEGSTESSFSNSSLLRPLQCFRESEDQLVVSTTVNNPSHAASQQQLTSCIRREYPEPAAKGNEIEYQSEKLPKKIICPTNEEISTSCEETKRHTGSAAICPGLKSSQVPPPRQAFDNSVPAGSHQNIVQCTQNTSSIFAKKNIDENSKNTETRDISKYILDIPVILEKGRNIKSVEKDPQNSLSQATVSSCNLKDCTRKSVSSAGSTTATVYTPTIDANVGSLSATVRTTASASKHGSLPATTNTETNVATVVSLPTAVQLPPSVVSVPSGSRAISCAESVSPFEEFHHPPGKGISSSRSPARSDTMGCTTRFSLEHPRATQHRHLHEHMAGQNHHMSRNVLDDSKARVPVYPPLDNRDVLVVSPEGMYPHHHHRHHIHHHHHQRPLSPSLTTSFTDLMIGDRELLQKSRDGRLGRCVDNRDTNNLYNVDTLLTDSNAAATIANLRDTIIALQLRNTEISLCLQQERRRREEAESTLERERGYIKRLEDNIQSLQNSRLVFDPKMYQQIAESYIASRRTPVSRTCSAKLQPKGRYEDLVCDSSAENSLSPSPTSSSSSLHPELRDLYNTGSPSSLCSTSAASGSVSVNPDTASSILTSSVASTIIGSHPVSPITQTQDLRWPSDNNEFSFSPSDQLLQNITSPSSFANCSQNRKIL